MSFTQHLITAFLIVCILSLFILYSNIHLTKHQQQQTKKRRNNDNDNNNRIESSNSKSSERNENSARTTKQDKDDEQLKEVENEENENEDDDENINNVDSSILIDPLAPKKSFLPIVSFSVKKNENFVHHPITKIEHQIQNGMQPKLFVRNIGMRNNEFFEFVQQQNSDNNNKNNVAHQLPNKIYLPDGQLQPMKQNHKYYGHVVKKVSLSSSSASSSATRNNLCSCHVTRPTIFLYRMSGHSTYHLWENNLGPFFQTLNDFAKYFPSSSSKTNDNNDSELFDPSKLLVVFTDNKPRHGPKNPHLLDQLLRTFTNLPLINASRIGEQQQMSKFCEKRKSVSGENNNDKNDKNDKNNVICFDKAILGISANSYRMKALVEKMKKNILASSSTSSSKKDVVKQQQEEEQQQNHVSSASDSPDYLPRCVYISRNHPSIIRGRKIANEPEFLAALNSTLIKSFSGNNNNNRKKFKGIEKVFMEQLSYKEQVKLASSVDIMFSPHGGGVANCIWMKPNSVMVEFVAPVGKTLPNMYHSMCSRSGIKHFHFLAEPDPEDEERSKSNNNDDVFFNSNKRLFSNMMVPVEMIEKNAEKAVKLWRSLRRKKK